MIVGAVVFCLSNVWELLAVLSMAFDDFIYHHLVGATHILATKTGLISECLDDSVNQLTNSLGWNFVLD